MNQTEKEKLFCNKCGKEIDYFQSSIRKDYVVLEKCWGYTSDKDGEIHRIVICEKCYDQFVKDLSIPPEISEMTELV